MQLPIFGKVEKLPKLWLFGGILTLLVAAIAVTRAVGLRPPTSRLPVETLTIPAQSETLTLRIRASGNITPRQTVNVSPKTAGRILELLVEQGDRVQKGQIIARMDDADLQRERQKVLADIAAAEAKLAQLKAPNRPELQEQAAADLQRSLGEVLRAEGEIARADGQVADAKSQLEFAKRQRIRQEGLQQEGAISVNSLDEFLRKEQSAQQALRQAQAQRSQAMAQLKQAQAQVEGNRARLNQQGQSGSTGEIAVQEAQVAAAIAQLRAVETRIGDTIVRAPFAGQVTQRYASVGAFVTPTTQASASGSGASSTSVVAIASELEVIAKVPEIDIGQVRIGQEVEVEVDAFPEETFKGKVRLVAPEAIEERDVRFFQVRLQLLDGQEKLRSGMNADLEFVGKQMEALMVPTVAIVTKRGQTGVLIPGKEGKPEFKKVTIGATQDKRGADGKREGQTQVMEGLQEGERVFVQLPEGQKLDQILKGEKAE
ncbi:MAG: efflux RND transporter periplasmic adaptor subunit [Synechococcales bacterium]|nr:efflux RND transporter periplasmic adaptor subunit [Synechococcales bacterium]